MNRFKIGDRVRVTRDTRNLAHCLKGDCGTVIKIRDSDSCDVKFDIHRESDVWTINYTDLELIQPSCVLTLDIPEGKEVSNIDHEEDHITVHLQSTMPAVEVGKWYRDKATGIWGVCEFVGCIYMIATIRDMVGNSHDFNLNTLEPIEPFEEVLVALDQDADYKQPNILVWSVDSSQWKSRGVCNQSYFTPGSMYAVKRNVLKQEYMPKQ